MQAGLYVNTTHCLQVVVPTSSDTWDIYGMSTNGTEETAWCGKARLEEPEVILVDVQDADGTSSTTNACCLDDGTLVWSDGDTWYKLACSHSQVWMLSRRPKYPPSLTVFVAQLLLFAASQCVRLVQCAAVMIPVSYACDLVSKKVW